MSKLLVMIHAVPASKAVWDPTPLDSEKSDVKLEAEIQDTWRWWEPEHLGILDDGCSMWVSPCPHLTGVTHSVGPQRKGPLCLVCAVPATLCLWFSVWMFPCGDPQPPFRPSDLLFDHSTWISCSLSSYGFHGFKGLTCEVTFQMYLLVFM